MITKKLWNSLSLSAKEEILTTIYGAEGITLPPIKKLLYEYKHDFAFDSTGKKLKEVLSMCYPTKKSNVINVRIDVKVRFNDKPFFLEKETPKSVPSTKSWHDYPYRGQHYVCDCEHMGDIDHEEMVIRNAGGIVDFHEWDGHDCGEAWVYYHCNSKEELIKVKQALCDD